MSQDLSHLTGSKLEFFLMLQKVPRIAHLWDAEKKGTLTGTLNVELFESELGVMSSGEVQMALFFASVWFHSNSRYGFDLVDAVSSIDQEYRELITVWIQNPFWP